LPRILRRATATRHKDRAHDRGVERDRGREEEAELLEPEEPTGGEAGEGGDDDLRPLSRLISKSPWPSAILGQNL
jgi:hypothetical protein